MSIKKTKQNFALYFFIATLKSLAIDTKPHLSYNHCGFKGVIYEREKVAYISSKWDMEKFFEGVYQTEYTMFSDNDRHVVGFGGLDDYTMFGAIRSRRCLKKDIMAKSTKFFEQAFEQVKNNLFVYDAEKWKDSSLALDIEVFINEQLHNNYPSDALMGVVENYHSKDAKLIIEADEFLREVYEESINSVFQENLKNVDKQTIKEIVFSYDILQNLTSLACDNVFELEQNEFKRKHIKQLESKQKSVFNAEAPVK